MVSASGHWAQTKHFTECYTFFRMLCITFPDYSTFSRFEIEAIILKCFAFSRLFLSFQIMTQIKAHLMEETLQLTVPR